MRPAQRLPTLANVELSSCSPSLYLYNLDYPGSINARIEEPTTGWTMIDFAFDDFEGGTALTSIPWETSNALLSSSKSCGWNVRSRTK